MMKSQWLYELSGKVGRLFQTLVVRDGRIRSVKGIQPLRAWTVGRDLRPIESQTFRELWRKELEHKQN
jgi:hypothetical protein